jgi:hypothetical protein
MHENKEALAAAALASTAFSELFPQLQLPSPSQSGKEYSAASGTATAEVTVHVYALVVYIEYLFHIVNNKPNYCIQ